MITDTAEVGKGAGMREMWFRGCAPLSCLLFKFAMWVFCEGSRGRFDAHLAGLHKSCLWRERIRDLCIWVDEEICTQVSVGASITLVPSAVVSDDEEET